MGSINFFIEKKFGEELQSLAIFWDVRTMRYFFNISAAALSFSSCFALYNGSPALPEMPENGLFLPPSYFLSLKTGYEGDYLLGRNLEISSSLNNPGIRSMVNGGTLTVGFINRIEFYTLLGATESKVFFRTEGTEFKLKSGQNFGGEIGFRANTPIWSDMKFGVDGKYFYAWPSLNEIKEGGKSLPCDGKMFQKEWQVGASISQTFAYFTPYVGVKFSKFSIKYVDLESLKPWVSSGEIDINNQSPFGFFVGMGISGRKGFYFDFEARFIDEYALTSALGISF